MRKTATKRKKSDITIAELVFFEKIGSILSSSSCRSMLQVALAAGFTNAHSHNALAKLEGQQRFGKPLVDRKRFSLTKDGEEVLAYARRVLDSYRLRPLQSSRVTLRVAATNRILTTLLSSFIPQFIQTYRDQTGTDIDIEILESSFDQVLRWLEIGEVEMAFGGVTITSDSHPKLDLDLLGTNLGMVLVAPPKGLGSFSIRNRNEGMKVSFKSLESTNLCLIRRDLRGEFKNLPHPAEGCTRIVVDNYSSVIAMVRARAAVGIVINCGIPADFLKFEFADMSLSAQKFALWYRKGYELLDAAKALKETVGVAKKKTKSVMPRK